MAHVLLSTLPAAAGIYVLVLTAERPLALELPRRGEVVLPAGSYAYVGSAQGPGGLRARIGRHARSGKTAHWHIDRLTAAWPIQYVVVHASSARWECAWVQRLIELDGASVPAPGFGSSDCRAGCPAHLVRLPDGLPPAALEGILAASYEPESNTPADLVQALLDAIDTGDDEAAEGRARACAGRAGIVPALRPLLTDADPDRRWWAVRALAAIGGDEAIALLSARLTDADVATRCAAALGLGQLRATVAIPALAGRLGDEAGWMRDTTADALAMIGEPALPSLVDALDHGPEGVRVRAAAAIRKIVGSALAYPRGAEFEAPFRPAIGALFRALNDPNRLVRHNAYETLDRLGLLETMIVPA